MQLNSCNKRRKRLDARQAPPFAASRGETGQRRHLRPPCHFSCSINTDSKRPNHLHLLQRVWDLLLPLEHILSQPNTHTVNEITSQRSVRRWMKHQYHTRVPVSPAPIRKRPMHITSTTLSYLLPPYPILERQHNFFS